MKELLIKLFIVSCLVILMVPTLIYLKELPPILVILIVLVLWVLATIALGRIKLGFRDVHNK